MRWLRFVLVIVGLITLCACHVDRPSQHDLSPGVDPAGNVSPTLPDGWRWESYHDVEVGVPADWGWGSSGQLLGQWCVDNGNQPKPTVGRPGFSTAVGCPPAKRGEPAPETLIKNTGLVVAFENATSNTPRGGDRKVVTYGHVSVIVQAQASLRTRVIATIHLIRIDHQGCPTSDPITSQRDRRPAPAADVTTLRDVTVVSVCRYSEFLVSSRRYEGPTAAGIVRQIAAAPRGGGPNSPETCTDKYGDEIFVLRVTSSTGESEIYARYSGCDHNGFDDGVTVRTLTRAPMQALIKGPNALSGWGGALDPILGRQE